MNLKLITLIISAFGVLIALITAIKALIEYRKQGVVKRSEILLNMRSRLREDPSFKNICNLLGEWHDPRDRAFKTAPGQNPGVINAKKPGI